MITIYNLKARFQNLLRPVVNWLAKIGVTPNQITISALLLSIVIGLIILYFNEENWVMFLVPIVLFIRMGLNAIDGMLAREHNMQSPLGAVLNELGDVISDTALYLPFAMFADIEPVLVIIAVILAIFTEMAGVISVQIGANRRYDGPMGKSDRAFVFGLIALLIGSGINIGSWLNPTLIIVNILLLLTIANRIRNSLKELRGQDDRNSG